MTHDIRERFEEKFLEDGPLLNARYLNGYVLQPGILENILSFISSEVEAERARILDIAHDVAHREAKKWEHENKWKQPYAGNRMANVGWEIRQEVLSKEKSL